MLYSDKSLSTHIKEMRSVVESLRGYSFPKRDLKFEKQIMPLKQRRIWMDGYNLNVVFNILDYTEFETETLQITSVEFPFLPNNVIFKLATKFLGSEGLLFINTFIGNKFTYIFQVFREKDGQVLLPPNASKVFRFENYSYRKLNSKYLL